jgi:hypothetical protein
MDSLTRAERACHTNIIREYRRVGAKSWENMDID